MANAEIKAIFIERMFLQRTEKLSEGGVWSYERKLDSFRAVAFKTAGRAHLRSRNNRDFYARYPASTSIHGSTATAFCMQRKMPFGSAIPIARDLVGADLGIGHRINAQFVHVPRRPHMGYIDIVE
ncbi:MAG: hypothetical protein WBY44_25060 [Bryobacteraceae bacterium]